MTVFKAVALDKGKYKSWCLPSRRLAFAAREYRIGHELRPCKNYGPYAAFTTLEGAERFVQEYGVYEETYPVLECEAEVAEFCGKKALWAAEEYLEWVYLPAGSILCKRIKPVRVAAQIKVGYLGDNR